jgi:hypothetical protein
VPLQLNGKAADKDSDTTTMASRKIFSASQLLMWSASFAMLLVLVPILGWIEGLFLPGALMTLAVASIYKFSMAKSALVCLYGIALNFSLLFFLHGPFTRSPSLGIYSALASSGLAMLCAVLDHRRLASVSPWTAALAVGGVASIPLWVFLTNPSAYLGNWAFPVAGMTWMWAQYFLHTRYLVVTRARRGYWSGVCRTSRCSGDPAAGKSE